MRVDYTFISGSRFGKALRHAMLWDFRTENCILSCFDEYTHAFSAMTGGEERVIFDMPVEQHLLFLDLLEERYFKNQITPEQFKALRKALSEKKRGFKLKQLKNWTGAE